MIYEFKHATGAARNLRIICDCIVRVCVMFDLRAILVPLFVLLGLGFVLYTSYANLSPLALLALAVLAFFTVGCVHHATKQPCMDTKKRCKKTTTKKKKRKNV